MIPGKEETRMRRLLTIALLLTFARATLLASGTSHAQGDRVCFPNVPGVRDCIEGRFREYWQQNGGLAVVGYPNGPALLEATAEGTFLTQYFERARFEYHPEKPRPYDVLLGRLGDSRLRQ